MKGFCTLWFVGLLLLAASKVAYCGQTPIPQLEPKDALPKIKVEILPTEDNDLGDLMEAHISKIRLTVPKGVFDVWCVLTAKSKHNGHNQEKIARVRVASCELDREQSCNVTIALFPLGESWSDAANYKWRVAGKSGEVRLGRQRVQPNPFHDLFSVNWEREASREGEAIALMGGSSIHPSFSMEMVEQADFALLSCKFILVPRKPEPKDKIELSRMAREEAEFEDGR